MSNKIIIKDSVLDSICDFLGYNYFSHGKITRFFENLGFSYICPQDGFNKKERIYNTLAYEINRTKSEKPFFNALFRIIDPTNFNDQSTYDDFLYEINTIFAHNGLKLSYQNNKPMVHIIKTARNIDDAKKKSNELRSIIESRSLNPIMLSFINEELLQENYFHAVLEATKSIYKRIQSLTLLQLDGSQLIETAFSVKNPYIIINNLSNDSEISEQKGFLKLLTGVTSMFRNPTAHEAKIEWSISKEDAIDLFTIISFAHRKLDKAQVVQQA